MPRPRSDSPGDTIPTDGLHLLAACSAWAPAGDERRLLLARHAGFAAQGWRHTIVAPGAHGSGLVDCGGVPWPGLGGGRVALGRQHAATLIEHAAPDIVEAADPFTLGWAALDASARLGIPVVFGCHRNWPARVARRVGGADGLATGRGRWAARQARSRLVRMLAHFDLVLAPQRALARRLLGWGVAHVVEQPVGVDTTLFKPGARDPAWRSRLARQLGVPAATRIVVYSGPFGADADLGLLADTVRALGPGHLLLAVGAGLHPPAGTRCAVLPPEPDGARLARLLASCDAFVHADDTEGVAPGVLQAMACGTPVVVAAAGSGGELAQDAGLRVDRRRVPEWAEAVSAALHGDTAPLTAAALERARGLDATAVDDQLARRYQALLRQHARPAPPAAAAAAGGDARVALHRP